MTTSVPRRLGLVLIAAALIAVTVAATASARQRGSRPRANAAPAITPATPVTRGSGYLALGDSVTFGYQEPGVVPAPNYKSAASLVGFPAIVGQALHLKVTNLSCPGETSASLINVHAQSNGCENAYRANFPLHARYSGSQLAAAVSYLRAHRGVRLVSLMIGANDGFLCLRETSDGCISELNTFLSTVSRNVRHILQAIRHTAGYGGQIVIVNYFSLNYASAASSEESILLNRAQDTAARPFHVSIADGYGAFAAAAKRFGDNPCLGGLITQLGAYGSCGVHPSIAGQTLLARTVITATRLP